MLQQETDVLNQRFEPALLYREVRGKINYI